MFEVPHKKEHFGTHATETWLSIDSGKSYKGIVAAIK